MTPGFLADERVVDLLVERAIDGLSRESSKELTRLSCRHRDYDDDAIDRVAAAVAISDLESRPVPEDLRKRLETVADHWLAPTSSSRSAPD